MSRDDDGVRLRHMLDHARDAVHLSQGRDRGDLDTDRLFNLAMVRVVEVIGEAAGRVGNSRIPQRDSDDFHRVTAPP